MQQSGYIAGSSASAGSVATADSGHTLEILKKDYLSYLGSKSEEIKEQKEARLYYNTSQYTDRQLKTLKKRGQPPVVYNHEAKKINSVVGILSRQRGDPKAYPRTQQQADGAEVATATLRYACDQQQWEFKQAKCTLNAAVDGIAGVELELIPGDTGQEGDYDVGFNRVDSAFFFYDPRSIEDDFSDARYMGMSKWADIDAVVDMHPDREEEIRATTDNAGELTSDPASEQKWIMASDGGRRRVRLVDHWYLKHGRWMWCLYIGTLKLAEGVSPFVDEKNNTISKFIMFSANIDQDGDRYGFHRNMKSSQDEINQRRSKALHISSSRRIIVQDGEGLDVEKIRAEIVKPDGVIVIPPGAEIPQFDDVARAQELTAQLGFFQEAKMELESGQFNPEATGNSEASISGRAIQLRQQAGVAELGPFLLSYRGWKLRLYRAVWNAIRTYWKAERAIRVTDDPNAVSLIPINQMGVNPQTGMPALFNSVNSLDVDIILDEGPDTITMQQSNADALAALGKSGIPIPPQVAIMLSDIDPSLKKQVTEALAKQSQPSPEQQAAVKLELAQAEANVGKTKADTMASMAKARPQVPEAQEDADPGFERWKALLDATTKITVARISAGASADGVQLQGEIDAMLHFSGISADAQQQLRQQAHDRAMIAMQPTPEPAQAAA